MPPLVGLLPGVARHWRKVSRLILVYYNETVKYYSYLAIEMNIKYM